MIRSLMRLTGDFLLKIVLLVKCAYGDSLDWIQLVICRCAYGDSLDWIQLVICR